MKLGCVTGARFEPHHNLFTAFGDNFKIKLNYDFNENQVKQYLRGETFDVDLVDGFGAMMVNNCPVGGFKISQGRFKNYYPKGLRNF